jgi:hypothetical protein
MRRSQEEFWKSSFAQVTQMIDIYVDELKMKAAAYEGKPYESKYFKQEVKTVKSLKEIGGLV